jgi:septal ring factor EnvC (AmiA/AmiB activator)
MAFPKLAALFGAAAGADLTDENLKTAEAKIAQLENEKATAEASLATAQSALATMTTRATTAEASLATAQKDLGTAQTQVATLEKFKKQAQATDEREEDESNELDGPTEKKAAFEVAAEAVIASAKRRKGTK